MSDGGKTPADVSKHFFGGLPDMPWKDEEENMPDEGKERREAIANRHSQDLSIMDRIFDDIRNERQYQDKKWGGPPWDDQHSTRTWVSFVVVYLGRAVGRETNWGKRRGKTRTFFIKIAAIAVAAIEAFDRRLAQ